MTARRQPYKPLLEKARRYIRSAKALQELSDYDSAVSRLYYAMFYCAELLVFTKGLNFSSHRAVISAFGQHFTKTGELPVEMHQWLRQAYDKRQEGDYAALSSLSEQEVRELLSKAETFLRRTEGILEQGGFL